MNRFLLYLTRKNIVTALVLLYVAIGAVKVLAGDLTLPALVSLLDVQVAALAIGAGLAGISFAKAAPGEPLLGIAAVLVLAYALVGAIQVLTSSLTFEAYLKLMDVPVAGLAIGKGIAANNGK